MEICFKSNHLLSCQTLMNLFNSFIEKFDLREIFRKGGPFTWTNRKENPICGNIDRVLVSIAWEERFPLSTLTSLIKIGSDHTPLLLDTGDLKTQPTNMGGPAGWVGYAMAYPKIRHTRAHTNST